MFFVSRSLDARQFIRSQIQHVCLRGSIWAGLRHYSAPAAIKTAKTSESSRYTLKPADSRKTFLIDSYKQLMETNPLVLFVHYHNLMKNEDHFFRSQIKKAGGTLTVLRNNLFSVYLKNSAHPDPCAPIRRRDQNANHPLLPLFKGPTAAITFRETNPQDVASITKLLEKAQDKLFLVGAKVEADVYDIGQLAHFQTLPSKTGLQAQLLGLLHVLSGAGLVRTLEASSQTLYLTMKSHQDNQTGGES